MLAFVGEQGEEGTSPRSLLSSRAPLEEDQVGGQRRLPALPDPPLGQGVGMGARPGLETQGHFLKHAESWEGVGVGGGGLGLLESQCPY